MYTVAPDITLMQTPQELLKDVKVTRTLGSGSFGVVFKGTYQGGPAAIKLVAMRKGKPNWREGLVSPHLRHPHVVHTMCVRAAVVTPEFLAAVWTKRTGPEPGLAAALLPSLESEDGLGNPRKMAGADEMLAWHEVFDRVGAVADARLLMLVQELCDFGSLSRHIQRGGFLPREGRDGGMPVPRHLARRMLLRTAAEICRAMIHLHEANVIHGDLKPANVLLARCGADRRGFTVKVADFGLARTLQPDANGIESSNCGTLPYCSPEVFNGVFSKKSDVYAFGVMLWEMMTGKRPFENVPAGRIMLGVSLQGLRPEWPDTEWPELCNLGRRCLAQAPEDRPDFREVEEALVVLEEQLRAESVSRRQSAESARSSSRPRLPPLASGSGRRLFVATVGAPADAAAAAAASVGGAHGSEAGSMPATPQAAGGGGAYSRLMRSYPDVPVGTPVPAPSRMCDSLDMYMSPWTVVASPVSGAHRAVA